MEKTPGSDAASFGEVLKELRTRKKRSRPRLARDIGVSASAIEKWERGDVLPDRARVADLIRALALVEEERLLLLEAHAGHRVLPSLHNLPAARNPYFTGREEVLLQLYQRLVPGGQVELTQAISGLGGIGKTQLALQYLYRFQQAYTHVLWAAADSAATLVAEFVKLAADLQLPEKGEENQGKIVRAVQRWLREYVDWLLVLDNVEDLGLVASFIPAGYLGSVLLTTRRQVTEPLAQAIVLDVLGEDEGTLLVLKRAKRLALEERLDEATASEVVIAGTITQELGGLPLALDQAGAYIAETGCSLSEYLELFKRERVALLERRGTVPNDHPLSVTATFALAVEQVRQKNAAAIDLLKLCAFLAPDTIPLEIFTIAAASLGAVLEPVAADALLLNQALETLLTYSLVRRDGEKSTLSIHRLVQAVLQEAMNEEIRLAWVQQAIRAVHAALPAVEYEHWAQWERLITHAQLCAQFIALNGCTFREATSLLLQTGCYLMERARYSEAEYLLEQVYAISERTQGPEHLDTAWNADRLATLYQLQGRYAKAEPLLQHALAIHQQQLGPLHPLTAQSLNNLALLYDYLGKYEQAELLYRQALSIHERQLGPLHPDTASTLNNLAEIYRVQGKYKQAEPLFQRALMIDEQVYGPEHPSVATDLNNLAFLYKTQGKYEQVEPLYRQALSIREQRLGPLHPDTASTLNNLAVFYYQQGKEQEAEPLLRRALAIREQQLGLHHPSTARSQRWLAKLLRDQGKLQEARALYEKALDTFQRSLGEEHPDTQELRKQYEGLLHETQS